MEQISSPTITKQGREVTVRCVRTLSNVCPQVTWDLRDTMSVESEEIIINKT